MSSWHGSIASLDSRAPTSTFRGQAHLRVRTRKTGRMRRKQTLRRRGSVFPVIFSALAVQDGLSFQTIGRNISLAVKNPDKSYSKVSSSVYMAMVN